MSCWSLCARNGWRCVGTRRGCRKVVRGGLRRQPGGWQRRRHQRPRRLTGKISAAAAAAGASLAGRRRCAHGRAGEGQRLGRGRGGQLARCLLGHGSGCESTVDALSQGSALHRPPQTAAPLLAQHHTEPLYLTCSSAASSAKRVSLKGLVRPCWVGARRTDRKHRKGLDGCKRPGMKCCQRIPALPAPPLTK